jgi:arylsulfatase A-like enzyme
MKYKISLIITLSLFLLSCQDKDQSSSNQHQASSFQKPNIIFIMTDDMGYGDATCYNPESLIPTPNLDKLAADGIRFTDAHSPSSVCTPTRYAVLTGRYTWRSRLKRGVFGGYNKPLIETDRITVASFLKDNGYGTACIGKWHLGWNFATKDGTQPSFDGGYEQMNVDFTKPFTGGPIELGFDYFFGTSGCTTDDPPMCFFENDRSVGIPDCLSPVDPANEGRDLLMVEGWQHEDADIEFKNKTVAFIEKNHQKNPEKPFFIYLPLSVPHIPWLPPDMVKGKSGAGPRGDQVVLADWIVGEIVKTLDNLRISDNTLVIFSSDNGPRHGINGHKSAWTWRGYKGSIWEGGHRVPFIAKWPGKIKPGTVSDQVTILTDLMATSAAIIGKNVPEKAGEDSYNILPALLGEKLEDQIRNVSIHHSGGGVFAIRMGDWKLIDESSEGGYDNPSESESPGQLYNLANDPREQKNMYNEETDIVAKLKNKLEQVKARTYREM